MCESAGRCRTVSDRPLDSLLPCQLLRQLGPFPASGARHSARTPVPEGWNWITQNPGQALVFKHLAELEEDPLELTGGVGGSLLCRQPWVWAQGQPVPSQVSVGLGEGNSAGWVTASVGRTLALMATLWGRSRQRGAGGCRGSLTGASVGGKLPPTPFLGRRV